MKQVRTEILVRYSIKGPGHGRVSFTIYKDVKTPEGKRITETIKDDRLNAINRALKSGLQDFDACRVQVKEIVKDLYKEDRKRRGIVVHNSENYKVLDEYWQQVYSFRGLINEATARCELKRAIECLGALSIYSASRDEIQQQIERKFLGYTQRRMVGRLTQILKFIGRDRIRLRKQPEEFKRVTYINEDDFRKVLVYR